MSFAAITAGIGLGGLALSAKGAVFYGLDMEGAQLQGAPLEGADLRSCRMRGADLRGARLTGARLAGADLADAMRVSNEAAGIVVGKVGTTAVPLEELKQQLAGN